MDVVGGIMMVGALAVWTGHRRGRREGADAFAAKVDVPVAQLVVGGKRRLIAAPPGMVRGASAAWQVGLGVFVLAVGGWGLMFGYAIGPLTRLVSP
jgi:hypothetical protein